MKLANLLEGISLESNVADVDGTTPEAGQGQARDARLDAQATEGMTPPLADYVPAPATEDVDAAIAQGRAVVSERKYVYAKCLTCAGSGWVTNAAGHFDLLGVSVCPSCGGTRASSR